VRKLGAASRRQARPRLRPRLLRVPFGDGAKGKPANREVRVEARFTVGQHVRPRNTRAVIHDGAVAASSEQSDPILERHWQTLKSLGADLDSLESSTNIWEGQLTELEGWDSRERG
jgi:hypothetical protein